jgi:hypothetical protein
MSSKNDNTTAESIDITDIRNVEKGDGVTILQPKIDLDTHEPVEPREWEEQPAGVSETGTNDDGEAVILVKCGAYLSIESDRFVRIEEKGKYLRNDE